MLGSSENASAGRSPSLPKNNDGIGNMSRSRLTSLRFPSMRATYPNRQPRKLWSPAGRTVVFALAASSIACLLADFYRLCPMRTFTLFIFLPASFALAALAVADRACGDHGLWRGLVIGIVSGILAAVAYDLFRLPFVFAKAWGINSVIPQLNLFKVFPAFGAMILGLPTEPAHYSAASHLIGWAYHFSNGMTFGVMFVAALGELTGRRWLWGVAMAVGLELGMLLTPYPRMFGIPVTALFVGVTLAAHVIFGVVMGLSAQWLDSVWRLERGDHAAESFPRA